MAYNLILAGLGILIVGAMWYFNLGPGARNDYHW